MSRWSYLGSTTARLLIKIIALSKLGFKIYWLNWLKNFEVCSSKCSSSHIFKIWFLTIEVLLLTRWWFIRAIFFLCLHWFKLGILFSYYLFWTIFLVLHLITLALIIIIFVIITVVVFNHYAFLKFQIFFLLDNIQQSLIDFYVLIITSLSVIIFAYNRVSRCFVILNTNAAN